MRHRAVEASPCHPRASAHSLHLLGETATHRDRFDAAIGAARYRQALALAEPHVSFVIQPMPFALVSLLKKMAAISS